MNNVNRLKLICQGIYYTKDRTTKKLTFKQIPNWEPKSPERITVEQFQEFISYVHKDGCCTNTFRIAFRDFWLSRTGQTLKPTQVSGEATSGINHKLGRWKNVSVPKETCHKILDYVKERYFLAFAADFTAYKTGSRHGAVLTQYLKSKVYISEGEPTIDVEDKGFHRKGRQTFPKILTPDLYAVLEECWKKNGNNPFTGLDDERMMKLNKEAYRVFFANDINPDGSIKEYSALELGLADPFHFWRHIFGRLMLEATNYNYTVVAFLGNWNDEKMLRTVYGAPPMAMLRQAGLAVLPQI